MLLTEGKLILWDKDSKKTESMNIQLIKGHFHTPEAIELITEMVQVKIKFLERKINLTHTEEDIKMRENRIRELQKDLHTLRNFVMSQAGPVDLKSEITIIH